MDHAFTVAVTAGIVGLTLLLGLLLRQGSRVLATLEAIRAERTVRLAGAATAAGLPGPVTHRSPVSFAPRPADVGGGQPSTRRDPGTEEDILVPVPAFDAKGNPRPKMVSLDVLLRAVGIYDETWDPALSVIVQAQTELKAFAALATHVGPENSEVVDLTELGFALADISQRLELAHELLGKPQNVRGTAGGGSSDPSPASEPPPSEEGASGNDHLGAQHADPRYPQEND
jgi:hypothetical protein